MSRAIRTLLLSTLYPSSERPAHGIFVEARLRELLLHGGVESRVVAPVPWFPSTDPRLGDRAAMARTALRETRHGIDVRHPRYAVLPKVGMTLAPLLLALGARRAVQSVLNDGFNFDLIDAHYYYPDGVAAALLSRWFGRPFVVTARGSDVNLIGEYAAPRRMMRWAAQHAGASIGVSQALCDRMAAIGFPRTTLAVLRNGVDAAKFRPEDQTLARQRLRLPGDARLLVSVGNLLPVKRHALIIDALAQLRLIHPTARLAIVGSGPLQQSLEARAQAAGLAQAVLFAGAIDQDALRWWYSAADLLVLASSREGWPNVLLEAMSCGTPVVASRVGGVPEIVSTPVVGRAVTMDTADELVRVLVEMLAAPPDRVAVRQYALRMSWSSTSQGQVELFRSVLSRNARTPWNGAAAP